MLEPQPYIIGRQTEVKLFADIVAGRHKYRFLNIRGLGGTSNTIIAERMLAYAREN